MLKRAVNVRLRARRSHKGGQFGGPLHKMTLWTSEKQKLMETSDMARHYADDAIDIGYDVRR